MRFLRRTLLILVLLTVVGLAAVHLWLDAFIEDAVEWIGPQVTRTSVTLDGVTVSFVGSQVRLTGLTIGSPAGFKAPHAIKVEQARVRLDWKTALSDPVVLEVLELVGPEVVVEGTLSRNNLGVLQDNIKAFSSSAGEGAARPGAAPEPRTGARKLVIKELVVTNGQASLWQAAGGRESTPPTLALPDIHLRDIGARSGGVTPQELSLAIVEAISREAARAVAKSAGRLGEAAEKAFTDAAKGIKEFLR